eukprot:1678151-Amphidinium_carterae.1
MAIDVRALSTFKTFAPMAHAPRLRQIASILLCAWSSDGYFVCHPCIRALGFCISARALAAMRDTYEVEPVLKHGVCSSYAPQFLSPFWDHPRCNA